MRKRITSLFLVLALCLSLLPTTAFAEDTSSVAREARDGTGVGDVYTIGEDTALQDEDGSDEAVQAAQALIDALPEEAADNAEELSAQLIAIDEALAPLTDEQLSALDMTRYEALCAVLAALTAEQADGHTDHALCTHGASCTICPEDAKTNAFTDAKALTSRVATENNKTYNQLYYDDTAATSHYNLGFEYFILPTGNYYLADDVTLSYAIRIQSGQTVNLCLNGHSITKITDDESDFEGVITIENGGTLSLCNCKSTGTITHADGKIGRGVRCGSSDGGATFNMYSGEISGNHAGTSSLRQDGAGVEMQDGTFTMYGGKITDNKIQYASNYGGGGVCLHDGASFTMYDGEISSNTSAEDGGGVFAIGGASFVMQGGTISNNEATKCGGGLALYNNGTFRLPGGIISDNTAANGGGVYGSNISLPISGSVEIKNNKAKYGGGVYVNSGTVNMSGGKITGNRAYRVFSVSEGGANASGGGVYVNDGTFTMSNTASITDNSVGDNGTGGGVYVGDASFTMNGGEISRNTTDVNNGSAGGVCLNGGSFIMRSGSITGNSAGNGAGGVDAAAGNFTMTGGSITGNTASYGEGGGIYARIPLNMSGTPVIQGNTVGGKSNNVQLTENNVITLTRALEDGAEIYVTPASEPTEDEPVTIAEGKYGNYNAESSNTDKFHKDDADAAYEITYIGGDYYSSKIVMRIKPHTHKVCVGTDCADSSHDEVTWKGVSSLTAGMAADNYYLTTDVTLDTTWEPASGTVLDLNGHNITMQQEGAVIDVTGSFTLTDCKGTAGKYGKITHTADVNGRGVDVKPATTGGAATFTMYGGSIDGNTVSDHGGGVYIVKNSTFTMYGGEITGNKVLNGSVSVSYGGGVYVDGGSFELSGDAIISQNQTANNGWGGGVYLSGGTFTMSGNATIAENTAARGGGVYMNSAPNFTMSGGSIYKNTATGDGGGVYAYSGTLNMSGTAQIAENTATGEGGGAFVNSSATLNMSGSASITDNKTTGSASCGGGVYVANGKLTMSGESSISKNTAPNNSGGGVVLYGSNGTFTMSDKAKVSENVAKNNGAGVYMTMGPTFTMNGGSISNNTATNTTGGNGGGVFVDGTFTMTDGTIGDNTAYQGGGVYISSSGTFHMEQSSDSIVPSVYGNGLTNPTNGHGGGVYVNGTFEIAGNVHTDNNSDNVYLPGDEVIYITGDLKEITPIGVTLASMPAGTTPITIAIARANVTLTDADRARFFAQGDLCQKTYTVQLEDNSLKLYLGQPHKHKVCVGTDCTDSTHANVSFSALTCETNVTGGKQLKCNGVSILKGSDNCYSISDGYFKCIYLTDDISIDGTIVINTDVTLCLNGHSITSTASGSAIEVAAGKTLTLCDCRGDSTDNKYGKITNQRLGRGVTLKDDSTFIMYSGEISGSCVARDNPGGGVYVPKDATFSVAGNARVTGNNIQNMGSQAIPYSNVYLKEGAVINVIGELGTDALISVTTEAVPREGAPVNIATTATDGWISAGKFKTDDEGALYKVTVSDDGKTAQLAIHDHNWRVEKGSADNILVERCATGLCNATGGTLTLNAPDKQYDAQPYSDANYTTSDTWQTAITTVPYSYEKKDASGNFVPLPTAAAPTAWGDYRVTLTLSTASATQEFKITPAGRLTAGDFIVTVPENAVYDENTMWTASATAKDSIASAIGAITVQYYDEDGLIRDTNGDPVTSVKDAGTYEVQLVIAAGEGYASDTITGGWTFTINPAEQTLSYAAEPVSKTYGDQAFTNPFAEDSTSTAISYTSSEETVATVDSTGKVTIVGAGTTTITAKAKGTTNYQEATATYTLNVAKKEITVSGITAENKYYDKTTNATLVCTDAVLTGKVDGDDLSVTATGTFDTANAGKNKTVTISGLTLTGSKAGNYKLAADSQQTTAAATINKMLLTIVRASGIADKNYDGNAGLSNVTVHFEDVNQQPVTVGYSINAHFPDADADETNVDVTLEVTLSSVAAENYMLTNSPFVVQNEAKINKVAPALPADLAGWQGNALSTVSLPNGWTWTDNTTVMNETGSKEFSAHYNGDPNHKAGDYTVTVTVSAKKSASLGNFAQPACTYGEMLPDATYDTVDGVTKTTIQYTGTTNGGTAYGPSSEKPTQAGSYTVTVTCETLDTIYTGTADFTIAKKHIDLDVTLDCGEGFVYDGTAKTPGVTVNFKDTTMPLPTDEYTVSYSNNIDASIGNRDGVVTIASTRTGNYTFGAGYYHFNISPKALTLPNASVSAKAYDGMTDATVTPGALSGIVGSDDVSVAETSVSGTFENQFVGIDKAVMFTGFTLTGNKAGNYTLTQPIVTGTIAAADQMPAITATASVPRGGKTLDLNRLVTGAQGTASFEISDGDAYATLSGSTLTTKDNIGTVKITVKISAVDLNGDSKAEYNAYSRTDAIAVSITLKEDSTVTNAPNGIAGLIYNGNDQTLITAGTADGGELQYKLNDGAYSKDLPTAQNAGDYTVYYKVVGDDEHEDSVEQSLTVTIQKATVTITAKDKSAYVGSQVPVLPTTPVENTDYTVVGLLGGDTLTVLPTLKYVDAGGNEVTPDMTKVNDVTISISGAAASANYEIHFVDGKLVITYRPSSGGGAVTYPVNIPDKAENGSVSSDVKNASKGSTVTITVKPDAGFKLADLTVTDKDGNLLEITDKGDEKYTFVMPAGKVEVNATFAKETERSPFTDVSTDDYYYEAVKWAAEQGITSGIGNGLFSPDSPCTRAQIVTFLWRTAGSPEPKTLNSFNDVVSGSYYEKAVAWAVENGITVGTSATTFSPEATCTRAHAVTFLAREAKATASGSAGFRDVADNAYYAEAVKWATDNGITNGIGGGLFGPDNDCTRAQIVTFLWRLYAGK